MDTTYIDSLLLETLSWAREAGAVHMRYFRTYGLDIQKKYGESDIVTVADRESERLLLAAIRCAHPDHAILSEESGASGGDEADYRWVIDPLDGTTNFNEGLPIFAVSIGLEYRGTTVAGVVFAPYLDELFHARLGGGAYLNGHPLSTRPNLMLSRAVISTGFPVDKDVNPDNNLANLAAVLPHVRDVRRLGSAAMDLCYVAAGYLDGYWELGLHPWDVSAGLLILSEAGGRHELLASHRPISIVAASEPIFPQLRPLLR
ncbi:MAG: inositol monophosphatase [Muribaculaceae bacterium]|nr:inositol monophosphatase [Muribaculaceae bacterium]